MSSATIVRPGAFQSPERRTRLLLASLPMFAGLLAEDGEVLECNFAPLGAPLEERTSWIGHPFETGPWWNYSEESKSEIRTLLGQARRGEKVSKERLFRRPDGRMGVMMLSLTPLFAPYGQPDAILVVAIDVTERRRETETSEHIAHDMAHRLRNSFTVMRTLATRTDPSDGADATEVLSHRLSQVRRSHSLSYNYLFFDVPINEVLAASLVGQELELDTQCEPVSVPADHVETIMMALGELSRPTKSARVTASKTSPDRMQLRWSEDTMRTDDAMPQGLALALTKTVPEAKTGGQVTVRNDASGFHWTFDFPFIHPDLVHEQPDGLQAQPAA